MSSPESDPAEVAKAAFDDPKFPSLNAGGICGAKHPTRDVICEVPAEKCFERHQAVHVDLVTGVEDLSWPNPRQLPKKTGNHKAAKDMADRVEGNTSSTPVPSLADPGRPGARVRSEPHQTEVDAADLSRQHNGTWRRKILDAIYRAGENGMIDYDIAGEVGYIEPRVASRRGELVADGWVEDSGIVRKTGTGSDAIVWVMTARGLAEYGSLD